MSLAVAEAIALGIKLIQASKDAIEAGRGEVSDAEIDAAISDVIASENALEAAIQRARARRAAER